MWITDETLQGLFVTPHAFSQAISYPRPALQTVDHVCPSFSVFVNTLDVKEATRHGYLCQSHSICLECDRHRNEVPVSCMLLLMGPCSCSFSGLFWHSKWPCFHNPYLLVCPCTYSLQPNVKHFTGLSPTEIGYAQVSVLKGSRLLFFSLSL